MIMEATEELGEGDSFGDVTSSIINSLQGGVKAEHKKLEEEEEWKT